MERLGAAARTASVTGVVRPAQSPPPRRRRAIEVRMPRPAETFTVTFHPCAGKDYFTTDRAATVALDLQKRLQFVEHGGPPVARDQAAISIAGLPVAIRNSLRGAIYLNNGTL